MHGGYVRHSLVSDENCQAGGPQQRWAIGRLGHSAGQWFSTKMISSSLPNPDNVWRGRCLSQLGGRAIGISWAEARDAVKHPMVHTEPSHRESSGSKRRSGQDLEREGNTGVRGPRSR